MKNMEKADNIASLILNFVPLLLLLGSFIFSIPFCRKSKKTLKTKIVGAMTGWDYHFRYILSFTFIWLLISVYFATF
jgi:hypothetical protein